jgi:aminopeptidase-like protein
MYLKRHYTSKNYYEINVNVYGDPTLGKLVLYASSSETSDIPYGNFVYDIELEDVNNKKFKVMKGVIYISPEVVR